MSFPLLIENTEKYFMWKDCYYFVLQKVAKNEWVHLSKDYYLTVKTTYDPDTDYFKVDTLTGDGLFSSTFGIGISNNLLAAELCCNADNVLLELSPLNSTTFKYPQFGIKKCVKSIVEAIENNEVALFEADEMLVTPNKPFSLFYTDKTGDYTLIRKVYEARFNNQELIIRNIYTDMCYLYTEDKFKVYKFDNKFIVSVFKNTPIIYYI